MFPSPHSCRARTSRLCALGIHQCTIYICSNDNTSLVLRRCMCDGCRGPSKLLSDDAIEVNRTEPRKKR
eukprot:9269991-Pyramimonas_sp.AAC.1